MKTDSCEFRNVLYRKTNVSAKLCFWNHKKILITLRGARSAQTWGIFVQFRDGICTSYISCIYIASKPMLTSVFEIIANIGDVTKLVSVNRFSKINKFSCSMFFPLYYAIIKITMRLFSLASRAICA